MPLSQIFKVANMCFSAIRENKIRAKFFEFTVLKTHKTTTKPSTTTVTLLVQIESSTPQNIIP